MTVVTLLVEDILDLTMQAFKLHNTARREQGLSKERRKSPYSKLEPQSITVVKREPCPEEKAGFFSRLTFWWLTRLIITAYKRPIGDSDLWALGEPFRASNVVPRLKGSSTEEQRKCFHVESQVDHSTTNGATHSEEPDKVEYSPPRANIHRRKPSLVRAIGKVFWQNFLAAAFFKIANDSVQFVQPQLLNLLIEYVEDRENKLAVWKGYIFAVAMFLTAIVQSFLLQYYFHHCYLLGMKLKTAMLGLIYEKALVLNNASRRQSTAGKMVNLMSIDTQRLVDLVTYINMLWSSPLQILIAIYFLSVTMGISILAGVGVLVLLIPVNLLVTRQARRQQVKQMLEKDSRIVIMDEVLSGIKVLKLYAWEEPFLSKIMSIRNDELKYLRNASCFNAVIEFTFTCAPFLVSFATFGVYVLTGNELTASKAFVAMSLFNIIRLPFTFLPQCVISFVQSLVSVKRIKEFLNLEEVNPENIQKSMPTGKNGSVIHVKDGLFSWDKDELPVLEDINLDIPDGSLVAVVGSVGSGKSSLLSAFLGETEKLEGLVAVKGTVAYVPQQAWMQNATLRDNITFGKPFNSRVYQKVIDACALKTDLEILPGGDMTEIGERGINLSGGQKQRINLARAVYFNADIYLLDDPLSAVDAHVGKHMFEKVIGPKGTLRKKTRVLVTHNISFLPQVDKIIVLKDGTISEEGTYAELMAREGEFADFVITYTAKQQQQEHGERRGRGYTYLEEIQETDNEENNDETSITMDQGDRGTSQPTPPEEAQEPEEENEIEGDDELVTENSSETDSEVISEGNTERRNRKQAISTKFPSSPNVNRKSSVQVNQPQNTVHPRLVRMRSWTLPSSSEANKQQITENTTPVFSGRYRSQTTLEFAPQIEDFAYEPSIWMPQTVGSVDHCERIRKISNIRGMSPRFSRARSNTVLSTSSWHEVENNELSRRKRAESLMSTITSDGGDVDFLCSSLPHDALAEMMTSKEVSQSGTVKLSIFWRYIKSMTVCLFVSFFLCLLLAECWSVSARIWLADWSSSSTKANSTAQQTRDLAIYGGLGFSQAVFVLLACFIQAFGSVMASRRLHRGLLLNILHSPMAFFETTPLGRIVNRFSKDMDTVDTLAPRSFINFLRSTLEMFAVIFIISFATPMFLSVILPLAVLYIFIQRVYAATTRQLRRIESISRSPIYNHFFETMNGVSTIRAYSQQQRFIQENFSKVDENQVAYYPTIISFRWISLRLEFIGNCVILFAALFAVISRDKIESGLAGLSIVYALQITHNLDWIVRKGSELESNIVSVERIREYSETTTEAEWIIPDSQPPDGWPQNGNITFQDFDLRYREGLPLVLKNINCVITPGEKIGIVGRTGAGKSTLTQALFRILERGGGKICIDDIDIATIGLQDLRQRLTIIPQDPVLFSGTLRLNLDPFGRHTDEELWQILEASHLKRFAAETESGLQFIIVEGGDNLSVGQRQLVCLARALLRKGKILVLDEATSAVDLETDELIQQTIRREFADRTVFTIAHRLNTIMDYTRIMVLDKGFVVEFDTPINLLAQKGIFYSMAQEAGIA
ncbi:hypothetical protein ACROYT_G028012 [Oculina patagonica]